MRLLLYDDAGNPCALAPIQFHADGSLKSGVTCGAGDPVTTGVTAGGVYYDTTTNALWVYNTSNSAWEKVIGNA